MRLGRLPFKEGVVGSIPCGVPLILNLEGLAFGVG